MKILLTLILFLQLSFAYSQNRKAIFNDLYTLYNEKQFFKLKNILNNDAGHLNEMQKKYFNSLVLSVFNRPFESNSIIDKLLIEYPDKLSDSMKVNLLNSKLLNCINLHLYKEALNATEKLLEEHSLIMKQDEIDELKNSALIWKTASDIKVQTIAKNGNTRLDIKKDIAGLTNIKVSINNIEEDFIFDTGANFSTVSRSVAEKLRMNFLQGV